MDTWKRSHNMSVISLKEGARLGKLEDFQFDLQTRSIYGWRLKGHGVFSDIGGVTAENLLIVGKDVAIVHSENDIEWTKSRRNAVGGRSWASQYQGTPVINRRGSSLGDVRDFVIDPAGNEVRALLLTTDKYLPLDDKVISGTSTVIIHDGVELQRIPEKEFSHGKSWWEKLRKTMQAQDNKSDLDQTEPEE